MTITTSYCHCLLFPMPLPLSCSAAQNHHQIFCIKSWHHHNIMISSSRHYHIIIWHYNITTSSYHHHNTSSSYHHNASPILSGSHTNFNLKMPTDICESLFLFPREILSQSFSNGVKCRLMWWNRRSICPKCPTKHFQHLPYLKLSFKSLALESKI